MIEIERKFLISDDGWRAHADAGVDIRQGYLTNETGLSVRVRQKGDKGYLTIKASKDARSRFEYEYEIPRDDVTALLRHCGHGLIEKRRYHVRHGDLLWEIDVFDGQNKGLIMAEVELKHADEAVDLPPWVGPEVTTDPRFFNAYLARRPFKTWSVSYRDLLGTLGRG
jgi:adenylate cyclase